MNVYNVTTYEIGVVTTKEDEDEVHEAYKAHGVVSEQEAFDEMEEYYDGLTWDVVRVRYIKKYLGELG